MKKNQNIEDLPAVLFPHADLPESMVKKILSFFGPLTIFRPWFMERPVFGVGANEANAVQVLRPPDNLKPEKGFGTRLSEYRRWIEHNTDKGYTEFLQASQENDLSESTTWEIRQMIRRGGRQNAVPQENHALKWHLILHLAQDMEDQKLEADKALKALKEKDVPLKGIVEESDDMESLLGDLPPFESEPLGDEYRLRQILEAWVGLFGGYLKENDLLVTSSRQVMGYVTDLWEESQDAEQGKGLTSIRFKFPDLSPCTPEELVAIIKTRLNDEKIRELKRLILDFGKNAPNNHPRLEALAKEVEASFQGDISDSALNIVVTYLPPFPERDQGKIDSVLRGLTNKTLALVEEVGVRPTLLTKGSQGCRPDPDFFLGKSRTTMLESEGWTKQFVACEPRLTEAVEMYKEAGFAVHLEPLPKEPECEACAGEEDKDECRICFEGFEEMYKIIFTRRKRGKVRSEDDPF